MRLLCIVNLRSGQADAGLYEYLRAVGRHGTEVTLRFLDGVTPLDDLLQYASKYDRVVAAGGDGTVSGVCYALRNTGIPVVAYPAGTANLLALNLGMPTDPAELAELTLGGRVIDVDLGEITFEAQDAELGPPPTGFVIAAGAGYDARIMEDAHGLKASIGAAAYLVSAMANHTPTVSRFNLEIDGVPHETEGIAVLLVNFGRLQFDISITHHSDPSDGVFEVVVVRSKNVAELIPAVWAAMLDRFGGEHPGRSESLEILTARTVRVEATPSLTMQSDGEVIAASTPFTARVLPHAARLVVPE